MLEYTDDDYSIWYGSEEYLEDDDNTILFDDDSSETIMECSISALRKTGKHTVRNTFWY
jgi:hypothetical protein